MNLDGKLRKSPDTKDSRSPGSIYMKNPDRQTDSG